MAVTFVNPRTAAPLRLSGGAMIDDAGATFPVIDDIPRFCEAENYTSNFGLQWNLFRTTQIDGEGIRADPSVDRFFAETAWQAAELDGLDILEVGSGAGRFSRVVLERTRANLYSIDYSTAVEANWRNNAHLGKHRFYLAQSSIYEMPFPDDRFDKAFCFGVLQHTPDFEQSVKAIVSKVCRGGEIVVDFYPIRGFWTKLNAKYWLRPITKRMSQEKLLKAIERNADWMIGLSRRLNRFGLQALTRFIPVCDIHATLPPGLSDTELREWVVLDTFDMFSPAFDNPQRIDAVAAMFRRAGCDVAFAGWVRTGPTSSAAVVRAVKR